MIVPWMLTYGTDWQPTGRRRHRIAKIGFWPDREVVMVLQLEFERDEWQASPPNGHVRPANAHRVAVWRDATPTDLLPVEAGR